MLLESAAAGPIRWAALVGPTNVRQASGNGGFDRTLLISRLDYGQMFVNSVCECVCETFGSAQVVRMFRVPDKPEAESMDCY